MFRSHRALSLTGAFALLAVLVAAFILLKLVSLLLFEVDRPLPPPENARYRDASVDLEVRVDDLLAQMTLEEKVGQMALVEKGSVLEFNDVGRYGIGGILSGGGGKPDPNTKEAWSTMVATFDVASRISRLGIPVLYGVDANHGHANIPGAVVFPHAIGLGAAGDEDLVEAVARATGEEMRATGIRWNFSPALDLPQDIRWGRTYEAFSDDPVLAGRLGAAYVRGLQGETERTDVLATLKHYIGVGAMHFGSSHNEDYFIDQGITSADERALRTEYLPPFQMAVGAGAHAVMVGLNRWGDTEMAASSHLINDVLKEELGFDGFVVSDWYGVYDIPGGDYHAAVVAINAGVDMVMLPFEYRTFIRNVTKAVRAGDIEETRINDAARRILRAKFALGLFDTSTSTPLESIGSDPHRALARDAVAKSLVLLKGEGVLPIKADTTLIRVAGSAADNTGRQAGGWTIEWQGVDGNVLPGATSILAGLQAAVTDESRIEYSKDGKFGDEDIADIGIAVVGEAPYAEGWGDMPEPRLSAEDLQAIERLKNVSKRVVVVLVTGRPLILPETWDTWDALAVAWLPGSEGAGVADVLFGKKTFQGKLPLPWLRDAAQLPINLVTGTANGTAPLFPRYFGLK